MFSALFEKRFSYLQPDIIAVFPTALTPLFSWNAPASEHKARILLSNLFCAGLRRLGT